MAQALRSQSWTQRTQAATRRRLSALLCALATVLSLALSACASVSLPGERTPTPESYDPCHTYGEAGPPNTRHELKVTPPVSANGVVYVEYGIPVATGYPPQYAIAALRASDGTMLWSVLDPYLTTRLALADGKLILISGSDLIALRTTDGARLWRVSFGFYDSTPLALSGGVLYAVHHSVYAIRVADGLILWQRSMGIYTSYDAPVVDGNRVYVGSGDGFVVALRADTGAFLWASSSDPTHSVNGRYTPLGVVAGRLYVGTSVGILRLNPANGASQGFAVSMAHSTYTMDSLIMDGTLYVAVGHLSYSAPNVEAYRLRTSDSRLLWRLPIGPSSPDLAAHDAHTLYLGEGGDGYASAIRLSDGATLWREQPLVEPLAGVVAVSGYLFETSPGAFDPCAPSVDKAPEILALRSADGSVAWTRALDAKL